MDWVDALKPVAGKLAIAGLPTLGNILGDLIPFPGGAIAGRMAGEWAANRIAEAMGVEKTPEAVAAAIDKATPAELQARLGATEGEAIAKWDAMARIAEAEAEDRTAQSEAINLTMRAELKAIGRWHWRHLLGYAVLYQTVVFTTLAAYLILIADIKRVEVFIALLTASVVPMGGIYALLGYVAKSNENMKIAAVTGEKPESTVAAVVKAAVKKR
jgi:hypothetical protein